MAKTWEPRSYSTRRPADTNQGLGRMVNPPRALKIGGRGEQTLYNVHMSQRGTNMGPNGVGPVSDRGAGRKA